MKLSKQFLKAEAMRIKAYKELRLPARPTMGWVEKKQVEPPWYYENFEGERE